MASYNKEEYRRASHQKYNAAVAARNAGHFTVAHYLAGVAVECMLRAHRWATDPSWDAKHDLPKLIIGSKVLQRLPGNVVPSVRYSLFQIARRWSVSHRYAPDDRLAAFLKKEILPGGKHVLERNADDMIQYTQQILVECDKRCP